MKVLCAAAALAAPSCSAEPAADTSTLFGDAAAALKSFAYIPLRDSGSGSGDGSVFGLLMLASEEPNPPLRVVPFTVHMALSQVFSHLKAEDIADAGAMQITVDSGLAEYNYILPAQSK